MEEALLEKQVQETCAFRAKKRAANVPAATLRQCGNPTYSWMKTRRRKDPEAEGEGV